MKILLVNKAFPPHIGGIETLVYEYAEGFSQMGEVEVLVCRDNFGKTEIERNEKYRVVRSGSLGTFASCPLSFSFFFHFIKMSKKADVIEFHMPFPLGDLALLFSGYKGLVVSAWHSDVVKQKKLLYFYKPILKRFLKRADLIFTATQGHIDSSPFLINYQEKCSILPYGIHIDRYLNAPHQPILSSKTEEGVCKLLFVGRLVYYKGVDILLKAMEQLTDLPLHLFIVGEGILRPNLEQQCHQSGLDRQVTFLGKLSDSDLKSAFSDCDIFVLPSVENSEAFGIVQLEAMVYGKPVINTSLPTGVPFVSIHNETGLTVPPRDASALAEAIRELSQNQERRAYYGKNAQERVKTHYSMQSLIEKAYLKMQEKFESKLESRRKKH